MAALELAIAIVLFCHVKCYSFARRVSEGSIIISNGP